MPKIRLIKVYSNYCGECDSGNNLVYDDLSDWEEITDQELKIITSPQGQRILRQYNNTNPPHYFHVVVFEDCTKKETIKDKIEDISKFITKQQEKIEKQERVAAAQKKKHKAAAEKRKLEKARKLLEEAGELQ